MDSVVGCHASLICISPPFFSDSAPFGCASKLSHSADAKLFPLGKLWSRYQQIKFTLVLSLNNSQSDSQDKKFNELPCHFPKNCYVLQCGTQKQSCIVLKEFCGGFCCFFFVNTLYLIFTLSPLWGKFLCPIILEFFKINFEYQSSQKTFVSRKLSCRPNRTELRMLQCC